jgi:hypothetical protein
VAKGCGKDGTRTQGDGRCDEAVRIIDVSATPRLLCPKGTGYVLCVTLRDGIVQASRSGRKNTSTGITRVVRDGAAIIAE